ncbi:MAG: hypothetical protein JWL98_2056 [Xanthomonadaceae bacterium]|nr:hypothetical protein [Xanthomonadaceae bacterium]
MAHRVGADAAAAEHRRRRISGVGRWLLATALAVAIIIAAVALLRVDSEWGAPLGPDRVVHAIDSQGAPEPDVEGLARAILRVHPDDGRAYRMLARIADARGDQSRAAALYAIAARTAPRDRPLRATLVDRAFAGDDIDEGFRQLDALLRVDPAVAAPLLQALMPRLADGRVRKAFAMRLASNPPWRNSLVPALLDKATPVDPALDLLAQLSQGRALSTPEADARLALLLRAGRDSEARGLWLAGLPAASRSDSATLFDGGFEHSGVTGAYAWKQNPPPGVAIATDDARPAQGAHALAIEFGGRAVSGTGLSQDLALTQGRYRLSAMVDNATDAQWPFAWRLVCRNPAEPLLTMPLPDPSTHGWQRVSAQFAVPADCPGQTLELELLARSLADRQINGSLRLDAMSIQIN